MLSTLYVILLAGLATLVTGAVLVGRRVLSVLTAKSEIESLKMKTEIDRLKHQRTVQNHHNREALIDLTTPKQLTDGKEKAEDPVVAAVEAPEVVKPKRSDILEKFTPFNRQHTKEALEATDAEWT